MVLLGLRTLIHAGILSGRLFIAIRENIAFILVLIAIFVVICT